jgi:tetratricopeptide (TPR) repeat protein
MIFVKNQPSKVAITGLGGVGKTQIALESAFQTRERYPECSIFWIPATNEESLQQAYLALGRQLGIPDLEEEQADVKRLVQCHLSQETAGRWLLIFDNADDPDMWVNGAGSRDTSRDLKDYLPRSSQGCLMFTTRSRKIAVKLTHGNVIEVSEMDEEVATQLLGKSLINQNLVSNGRDTVNLLKQLTFLPLAITQAAAYINENGITLSDYSLLLNDQESNVIELLSEDFEDEGRYRDAKNPVATTWLISFEQIRRLDPLAAEYLSFMSCVDPREIPQSLLPPAPSQKRETDAIGTLSAYSFVSRRPADHRLDLHRLVHLATRNWLKREEVLGEWTAKAVARLVAVFPDHEHKNRSVWRGYLPHARYVLASNVVHDGVAEKIELLWKFGMCLYSDGRYDEAEALFAQVTETSQRVLGAKHPHTLSSINNLALTYSNQGRWKEAEKLEVQVIETRKRVQGAEHPDTLLSINNLASTYSNQGRWKEAEELEVQVMESRKRVQGAEHPDTLTSINNLASTYSNQGRWKEAEELEVQVIESNKRVLGAEHPDTLSSINNLALTYSSQGRWKEAEELEVQVMESRKRVLGAEHPDTLTSINNLAFTLKSQGRNVDAIELMTECVQLQKEILGVDHPHSQSSIEALNNWQAEDRLDDTGTDRV